MTNEIIKVEEITSIMQGAPEVISQNENSVKKCNEVGQSLIDTIEANGGINSDELDAQVAAFISKSKVTIKNMNERRKGITQLFTKVSRVFTTFENEIDVTKEDTLQYKLQALRNEYVAKKLAEQQKKDELARRKLAHDNELAHYKTEYEKGLYTYFNTYLTNQLNLLQSTFNEMTYQNFLDKKTAIVSFKSTFDATSISTNYLENIPTSYLEPMEKMGARNSVISESAAKFQNEFSSKIEEKKQELRDLFNSKHIELKNMEDARLKNQEEFQRLEAEKAERERKEKEQLEQQRIERERKQQQELEMQKQAEQMNNMFAATAATVVSADAPKAKVTKKINITHAAGFLSVYQLWFEKEGKNLTIDELEKAHKKMITFCEKLANKDEEFINSPYLEYVDDVKAK